MKTITIFTPSYNRGYCIHQLYESLLRQTSKDFKWLVVDDGSTDNTEEIVNGWIAENKLEIQYIKQRNKGMLGAHNTAYDHIDTYLNVCIDSDDFMTDNAVERIIALWNEHGSDQYAGLLGLDAYKDGKVIGTEFPEGLKHAKFSELRTVHGVTGDKKFVYRTSVINEFPRFPYIEGEKFPAAGLLYRMIDKKYDMLTFNEFFCIVEYMPDGNSKNKLSQYKKNPNSFALYRIERMKLATSFKDRFQNAVHYVSSCLLANKVGNIFKAPYKFTVLLAVPFGFLLYLYIKNTKRKNLMK
jgi:glycosyltransferase involved in cell wall biosynthesis